MKSSSKHAPPPDVIQIGKVIGVHGLKGEIRVYSYAESAEHFAPRSDLVLMDEAGRQRVYEIAGSRPHKNVWRIALVDVTHRDQAQDLIGRAVLIHRTDLPPLENDAYYWVDLLGMAVYTGSDDYLGQVTDIIATGANDVYVVTDETAAGKKEILIPALASVVIEIDLVRRRMRVELPEGLE